MPTELIKHLSSAGGGGLATLLAVLWLLNPQIQQANDRADQAMRDSSSAKTVVERIDKNLDRFMLQQGVQPIARESSLDTTYVVDSASGTTFMVIKDSVSIIEFKPVMQDTT